MMKTFFLALLLGFSFNTFAAHGVLINECVGDEMGESFDLKIYVDENMLCDDRESFRAVAILGKMEALFGKVSGDTFTVDELVSEDELQYPGFTIKGIGTNKLILNNGDEEDMIANCTQVHWNMDC